MESTANSAPDSDEGRPIDFGFVILEGRYLPAPYVVARRGEQVLINGVAFDAEDFSNEFRQRRSAGRRGRRFEDRQAEDNFQAHIEQFLLFDGMIIRFSDGTVRSIYDGYAVMDVLLSEESPDVKLRMLMTEGPPRMTTVQWSSLIDHFQPTDDLWARWQAIYDERRADPDEVMGSRRTINYILTVAGMLLAVLAFGVVLGDRPRFGGRWSERNGSQESVQLVIRCAILIALLSTFDLVCTYWANRMGGFWEINPFGSVMANHPAVLAAFKLATTFAGILILIRLRLYHGTQVASWWLCLVLALLTARWVMFNSLLLA